MDEEEILKRCEVVIYRAEAELDRRIQRARGQEQTDLQQAVIKQLQEEYQALVELRQQVQWWRSTGNLLDDSPDR